MAARAGRPRWSSRCELSQVARGSRLGVRARPPGPSTGPRRRRRVRRAGRREVSSRTSWRRTTSGPPRARPRARAGRGRDGSSSSRSPRASAPRWRRRAVVAMADDQLVAGRGARRRSALRCERRGERAEAVARRARPPRTALRPRGRASAPRALRGARPGTEGGEEGPDELSVALGVDAAVAGSRAAADVGERARREPGPTRASPWCSGGSGTTSSSASLARRARCDERERSEVTRRRPWSRGRP